MTAPAVVLSSNPNGFCIGDTPPCCGSGGGGGCYGPRVPFGSNGVGGFPQVTAYVGMNANSMDGQLTAYLYPGLVIFTSINNYGQSWVVRSLGTGQSTVVDSNGNYTIIRAYDTAITGLCFVLRN
jgi:hypothetical protein